MKAKLYRYNTELDGIFYRLICSWARMEEHEYANTYTLDVHGKPAELVWEEQFDLEYDCRNFANKYLGNFSQYTPKGTNNLGKALMCFKGEALDPYEVVEVKWTGDFEHNLILKDLGQGVYGLERSSYDEDDCVWSRKFKYDADLKEFETFITTRCISSGWRVGGNPKYNGFKHVFRFKYEDISLENLYRLYQESLKPKKSTIEDEDIPF